MQTLENVLKYTGGVEEEKDECECSPDSEQYRKDSMETDQEDVGDEKGFRAQLEEFSKFFFGSCGNLLESAFYFTRDKSCRWNGNGGKTNIGSINNNNNNNRDEHVQPLSIAEELKRLAAQEGPVFRPRAADIPRFLGEDAVYSFEDDNVSAISQHTLEEMARKGFVHPMCRSNGSHGSNRTPSPGRTRSSTSSGEEKRCQV